MELYPRVRHHHYWDTFTNIGNMQKILLLHTQSQRAKRMSPRVAHSAGYNYCKGLYFAHALKSKEVRDVLLRCNCVPRAHACMHEFELANRRFCT